MKINTKSISFRLLLSFVGMGIITVFLVGFTIFGLGYLVKSTREVFYVKQPSQMWTFGLSKSVQKSNVQLHSYLTFQEESYQEAWKRTWEVEIQEALDSLNRHAPQWNDPKSQVLYAKILNRLNELKEAQKDVLKKAGASDDSEVVDDNYDLSSLLGATDDSHEENAAQKALVEKVLPISQEIDTELRALFESIHYASQQISLAVNNYLGTFRLVELTMILAAIFACWVLYYFLSKQILTSITELKSKVAILGNGNLPEWTEIREDELQVVHEELHELTTNLRNVKGFALEVGKGHFDNDISVFNNQGEIGSSLAEMRNSLKKVAEEDKIRNWTTKGVAEFGEILRQHSDDLDTLADRVLTHLIKYLNVNQGSLFVLNEEEEDDPFLELKASYAFDRKKFIEKRIEIGQGLIGQCYLEKQSISLSKVPDEYITITSGLGLANPKYLLIVPLNFNESVFGVIELASFAPFAAHEVDFVEKLGESIASSLSNVRINQNTRKLLNESQMMTEQMRAQEEEMRQNMEELQATQEEMQRGARERDAQEEELRENYEKMRAAREEATYLIQKFDQQLKAIDNAIIRVSVDARYTIIDANAHFTSLVNAAEVEDLALAEFIDFPAQLLQEAKKGFTTFEASLKSNAKPLQGKASYLADEQQLILVLNPYPKASEGTASPIPTEKPAPDETYLLDQLKEKTQLLRNLGEE
ncbi:GAF domain-containing protein [Cytophagales bacterium LB-30]|uniref:GAF domain-containing protein n=1 Tax=Shiella aurantiaca TaxID=3058365 RepID=A0ABT8F5N4_9BACT|nr:GAF domain-containing protein [Shiella aurantiaca]MDN4165778.1 GAF domain-containing protein [Shiella aurantiaca]